LGRYVETGSTRCAIGRSALARRERIAVEIADQTTTT
jgi:hypothetical protein